MRPLRIVCFAITLSFALQTASAAEPRPFDIQTQALSSALNEFARQSDRQLLFSSSIVAAKRSSAVKGALDPEVALRLLLEGTGLVYRITDKHTILVEAPRAANGSALAKGDDNGKLLAEAADPANTRLRLAQQTTAADQANTAGKKAAAADQTPSGEMTVTGTHIRGVKDSTAPSMTITREDIENSGYTTVEDLFRSLPQNFAEVSSEGVRAEGSSHLAAINGERASGVDLRGLGADSTLTLLNGQRRAGSIDGRVVDISLIPLSIIERVDIVTDGRSAIYGSDAVGGVVNFITRHDFQGAQTEVSYDRNREGSENMQVNQIAGANFTRGGFLAAYGYERGWRMNLVDLGGIARFDPFGTEQIYLGEPDTRRHSAFLSGHFAVADAVQLYADALYAHKKMENNDIYLFPDADNQSFEFTGYTSDHLGASAGATVALGHAWSADISAAYSRLKQELPYAFNYDFGGGDGFSDEGSQSNSISIRTVSAVADGPLPRIAGMQPRGAVGADYRKEHRELSTQGIEGNDPLSRNVRSLFAEVWMPVARQLELSIAGRYDDYSDFGSTFNPQAGFAWRPAEGLTLKSSYSRAFRAPALTDMGRPGIGGRLTNRDDPAAPGGVSPVLVLSGSNPDMGPEKARTWSFSVDYQPPFAQQTKVSLSYFDIRYQDRLDVPATGADALLVLEREDRFVGLIDRHPTQARIDDIFSQLFSPPTNNTGRPYNPNTQNLLTVFPDLVVFDNRTNNIAVETASGLDLRIDTRIPAGAGALSFGVNGTYTLDHERSVTATSPPFERINEVGKPSGFRLRSNLGWSGAAFGSYLYLNYVRGYVNPFASPLTTVDSWTTADATLRYESPSAGGWLSGTALTFSVQNLLNSAPPEVTGSESILLYDPTNASALGRHFSLQLMKKW